MGKFRFVVLASLRAVQLTRGCTPRVTGIHKRTTMAQLEVAQGKVIEDLTPVSSSRVV
jgi:DNA-directed RNA polymerase subunit K/omega